MCARTLLLLATLILWEGFKEGASPTKVLKRRGRGARVPVAADKLPLSQWETGFKNSAVLPLEFNDFIDRGQSSSADVRLSSETIQMNSLNESAAKGTHRNMSLTVLAPVKKAGTKNTDFFKSGWFDHKGYSLHRKADHSYPSNKTRFKSLVKSRRSPDPPVFTVVAQGSRLSVDHGRRLNSSEILGIKFNPEQAVITPPQRAAVWEENAKNKTSRSSTSKQGVGPQSGPKSLVWTSARLRKDRVTVMDIPTAGNKSLLKDSSQSVNSDQNPCADNRSGSIISTASESRQEEELVVNRGHFERDSHSESPLLIDATPQTASDRWTEAKALLISREESSVVAASKLPKRITAENSWNGAIDLGELDPRQRDERADKSQILRLHSDSETELDRGTRTEKVGSKASVESHSDSEGLVFQVEDGQAQGAEGTRSRSRRSWIWNQFFVIEEYSGPEPVLIGRLRTDMDRGDGRTKYVLRGEGAGSVFVIDEKTGNIHVTKPLDREEKDEYRLIATATDRQTDRALEPSSQFIIRVQDINDNPPVFQDGPYSATIPEMANIAGGVSRPRRTPFVPKVEGKLGAQLVCAAHPQTRVCFLSLSHTHSQVCAISKDTGKRTHTTGTTQKQEIMGCGDRAPPGSWSFSVSELALPGAEVGRLSATDADLGANAEMEFSILDAEGSDTFNITGREHEAIITLNKAVDYETRRSYSFVVEVLNPTVDPRFLRRGPFKDRASVRVAVLDADEPPRFSRSRYLLDVYENCPPPCPAGRVDAVDPDSGLSSSIRFSIDPQSDPETLFRVAPDSGLITTAAELDREHERWHNITVIATQRDSPTQVSRAVVAIETLDVNDNAPELERHYSTVLCDSTAVGQVVQVLRAVDKDQGDNNSVVHFSIAPESSAARNFSVRESGGPTASLVLLSPLLPLSRSPASSLTLQVPLVLRDTTSDLSSTGTVTVSVCPCVRGSGKEATCLPLPSALPSPGLSTAALLAILACVATLLAVSALSLSLRRHKRDSLAPLEEDDVRENIITYDDEGGGEADTAAFDITALQSAPHSARRGYRTLDSRNIRYPHQNRDRSLTSLWTQNPGLEPQFPVQEATLYGRLFYSSRTLPVLRTAHPPFQPGLSFHGPLDPPLVLQNQAPGKSGTSKNSSEEQGVAGGSDSSSMQTAELKENQSCSEPSDGQLDQDQPPTLSEDPQRSTRWVSSVQPAAEPTGPPSITAECSGDSHQGELLNPPEENLDFGGLEMGSGFVVPRPELEGGISVTGTTCSLYQEGMGFIADWRNRIGIGGYVLGRREMIPQLLPFTGHLGYVGGRGRSLEAGGGGAGSLALKVGEFLRLRLAQVTFDPSLPPYDSVQIYGFEGEGSQAGSLSSLESEGDKETGGDWGGGPAHWGPRFQRLAELLQESEREPLEESDGEREPPVVSLENGGTEEEKLEEPGREGEGGGDASLE
ncbi:cadherin-11-like [Arapaima gigas]